jgi:hypothetical protein
MVRSFCEVQKRADLGLEFPSSLRPGFDRSVLAAAGSRYAGVRGEVLFGVSVERGDDKSQIVKSTGGHTGVLPSLARP